MEWTYGKREDGQSLQDFFAKEIAHEDETRKFELLALSPPENGVCYGAYHLLNKSTGEERISALVIPVQLKEGEPEIAFKILTEYDCPLDAHQCCETIYALLTRFRHCEESAHAKAWRDRVEKWQAARVSDDC